MAFAATQKVSVGTSAGRMRSARAVSRRPVKVFATQRVDRYSKNDIIVSPSILSADFSRLGDEASRQLVAHLLFVGPVHILTHRLDACRFGLLIRLAATGYMSTSWMVVLYQTSQSVL